MRNQDNLFDAPGESGPDYVALVLEWDDLAATLEADITTEQAPVPEVIAIAPLVPLADPLRAMAAALGAIALAGFAIWGIHRLRAA